MDSPAVRKWLGSIGESSRPTSLWHFESFIKWTRVNDAKFGAMTPDQLVEYVLDGSVRDINELLDVKKKYIQEMTGSSGHKGNANKAVRSFFTHNRATLPLDATLHPKADDGYGKVEGTLTPEEVKRVILASDRMYQAVFQIIIGGGFGKDEFITWSDSGLEGLREQLGGDLVRVNVAGRKGSKGEYNYHTYIGGDALAALRRYMSNVRPALSARAVKRGEDASAVFLNQWGRALTKDALYWYWTRKTKRLAIAEPEKHRRPVPRYGKNLHEVRDVFRTLWRKSGQPVEYAEFFMGHEDAFDKYGYDKTYRDEAELREKYRAALPWLNLLSSNKPYDLVSRGEAESEELQSLRVQLDKLTKDMSLINQLLEDPDAKVPMWQAMEIMKTKKASTQA